MITINNTEYKFKFTLRAMMLFEQVAKKPFSINSMLDEYLYLYCMIMANNTNATLTFEDLIDAMDEDPSIMVKFKEALEAYNSKQNLYLNKESGDIKKNN